MAKKSVPLIDMEDANAAEKIVKAFEEWGCFRLVNHGVAPELMAEMMEVARALTDLPMETKMRTADPIYAARGYTKPEAGWSLYEGLNLFDVALPGTIDRFCSQIDASPNHNPSLAAIRSSARRSRSWASNPRASGPPPNSPHQKGLSWDTGRDAVESLRILKSVPLDFDQCTPVKGRPPSAVKFSGNFPMSPAIRGREMRDGSAVRSSAGGTLLSKMMETPMMRKSCVITPSAYNTLEAEGEADAP